MSFIAPILISVVVSSILTAVIFRIAKKSKLTPAIRDRDMHRRAIPRIGGLAIFLTFFVVTLGYHLSNQASLSGFGFPFAIFGFSIDKQLLAVLLGGLVLVGFMLFDDLKGLKAYQKLAIQIIVCLIIIAGGIGVSYINNPFGGPELRLDQWQIPIALGGVIYHYVLIADTLTIIWLVMLMNVLNFSDGIDGLAGTIAAVALFVLMILSSRAPVMQPATALLASIGVGSVAGFLVWNLPPARIFMGDTGSMFLGFLIGVLGLISGAKLATTLVVLAIPIIDAFWVIGSRLARGKNPLTHPDQTHLHHRLLKAGLSMRLTYVILLGISTLFGIAALQRTGLAKVRSFGVALAVIAIVIFVAGILHKKRDMA